MDDSPQGAEYRKLYEAQLDEIKVAYSGTIDVGNDRGDYVRLDGPRVWIEFATQGNDHYHTMLILIAGITGNVGQHAARYALSIGHSVRGLSRSPEKLDSNITARLESFVNSQTYYDVPALDAACAGVDAIICAYSGLPMLHLDGQLLLLRAAERAGVKIFFAASFNNDWRKLKLGDDAKPVAWEDRFSLAWG